MFNNNLGALGDVSKEIDVYRFAVRSYLIGVLGSAEDGYRVSLSDTTRDTGCTHDLLFDGGILLAHVGDDETVRSDRTALEAVNEFCDMLDEFDPLPF